MVEPEAQAPQRTIRDGESRRSGLWIWLFALPRFLFKIWFGLVFVISLVVLYIPFRIMLYKEDRYRRAFRWMRRWAWFLQHMALLPVRVERRASLPEPPYVICCNHGSYLDIIQMYNVMPDYFVFMGKHELLKWPLFNMFFKGMNIAVNRSNRTEAARSLLRAAKEIDGGACIALFPEGTIPFSAPRMKVFKDGAFRLAIEKQVPIVPVTFLNNWRLFGDPERFLSRGHPGVARAVVHAPIVTKGMGLDDVIPLRKQVHDIIEGPLREHEA